MNSQMTPQELFDRVAIALLKQGRPSYNSLEGCCYRMQDPEGGILKCAAGHLIPDELYSEDIENVRVLDLSHLFEGIVGKHNLELLHHLQRAHDASAVRAANNPAAWKPWWIYHMRRVAEEFDLSPDVLTKKEDQNDS